MSVSAFVLVAECSRLSRLLEYVASGITGPGVCVIAGAYVSRFHVPLKSWIEPSSGRIHGPESLKARTKADACFSCCLRVLGGPLGYL